MQWIARALRPYILRRTKETVLSELPERSSRVMAALMQMKKLDIATLQKAYDGR